MQIGNAVINDETDELGMYQYFGRHALVSEKTIRQMEKHCNFSPGAASQSKECTKASDEVDDNIDVIDIYNIYAPLCFNTNLTVKPKKVTVSHTHLQMFNIDEKQWNYSIELGLILLVKSHVLQPEFDPCSDYYVYAYLNRADVQKALHANVTKLKYDWEPCSDVIQNWTDSPSTIIPLLHEFMENGLRVWVFR